MKKLLFLNRMSDNLAVFESDEGNASGGGMRAASSELDER